MTLTEFLLARIAEDEAALQQCLRLYCDDPAHWPDDRVLAECEAKLRIVEDAQRAYEAGDAVVYTAGEDAIWMTYQVVLQNLALPYADHEDYDPAWRA